MSAPRDPRIDPKPGDILIKGPKEREVDYVYDDCVTQPCPRNRRVVYVGQDICSRNISIRSWRKWAAGTKIERLAK